MNFFPILHSSARRTDLNRSDNWLKVRVRTDDLSNSIHFYLILCGGPRSLAIAKGCICRYSDKPLVFVVRFLKWCKDSTCKQ